MLEEKPDNAFSWRNRLEQLESLPEQHLTDKTQLWEKLHIRLQAAPVTNKTKWYWLAAACLLFVVFLPLIWNNQQHPVVVKSTSVQRPASIDHPRPEVVTLTLPSLRPMVIEKQVIVVQSRISKQGRLVKPARAGSTARIKPAEPIVLPVTTDFTIPVNHDTVLITSSQPQKKKLRVIHINELEQPLLENVQSGSKQATAAFQRQRSRVLRISDFEFGSNNSEEILKIKLSPSN